MKDLDKIYKKRLTSIRISRGRGGGFGRRGGRSQGKDWDSPYIRGLIYLPFASILQGRP
jgi:hypothetical protein